MDLSFDRRVSARIQDLARVNGTDDGGDRHGNSKPYRVPKSVLGLLGVIPSGVEFGEAQSFQGSIFLHRLEPGSKTIDCPPQGQLKIDVQMASDVDNREEDVIQLHSQPGAA